MHLIEYYGASLSHFFFSSRRRHTSCGRDWSSDVCSSDLARPGQRSGPDRGVRRRPELPGQLRPPGGQGPARRRLGARQRLPGPAGDPRPAPGGPRRGPVRRPDRLRHPPRGLRAQRRAILTHSPQLHAAPARGLDGTTLAKATRKLDELAATLARGATRRPRPKVEAEIEKITRKT